MELSLLLMEAADSVQQGLRIILILGGQLKKIQFPIGLSPFTNLYNPKRKNQNTPFFVSALPLELGVFLSIYL